MGKIERDKERERESRGMTGMGILTWTCDVLMRVRSSSSLCDGWHCKDTNKLTSLF